MTAGTGKLFRPANVIPSKEVIFQLREITGASPEQVKDAYVASNGDVQKAVTILTGNQTIGTSQPQSQVHVEQDLVAGKESSNKEVIEISDDKDDDLAKAIELSLREAHGGFASAISDEDREISKALEASLVDSRGGNKRKRGNIWMSFIDPENPHDRERKNDVPVGLKNIGNTCWFSAVIQSLFHLPKFRNLVLNCGLSAEAENLKDQPKLAFMLELQKLFSLLLQSQRKYVDPAKPIEILEEAIRGRGKENAGDQQDVSEFNHVLLDWLEEAFKSTPNSSNDQNPIAELFYGRYSVNGCYDGKEVKNEENFGALPLHVRGHDHLYDGLDDAMVNNEIRTNNQDASANSTQEHWFTHLPAVLTFELSRFIFNQQLSKAEKIHDPFRIEQTIYLARYMECNKDLTREKRRKVDKLKRKRRELLSKLDKYTSFGTGPKKAPIMTTLDSTLSFIRKGLTREDQETPMMISPSSSPSSSTHASVSEYPEVSPILAAAERVQGPAPKSMTAEEGNTIIDCLQRWRDEIQLEAETLRKGIEYIDRELQQAYDEESFMQVPYRLHAILVHEGQANGGHYWSYIFDSDKNVWRKFNDITVTETTWEDVQKESIGGYRNTSAYCLLYVDASRTDLFELDAMEEEMPRIVREYVELDERKFREEIEEWDAKQRRKDRASEASSTTTTSSSSNKENTPMSVDPRPSSSKPETTTELSLDEQLDDLYSEKCAQIASHISGSQSLDADLRVDDIVLYFYTSKAPNHVIHQGFLEWLTGTNTPNERILLLQKHAKWKLKKLEENAKQNEEYKKWKDYFKEFNRANACFVAGAEAFYSQRYREALPYFVHAMETNDRLSNADFKPSCMEKTIVSMASHYRRQCLLYVNEEASKQFESINSFEMDEGSNLMKELVLPSLSSLSETQDADDLIVAETVRGRWCAFVGNPDIQGRKNEILEEILVGLVDSSGRSSIKLPLLRGPITGPDLYKRYAQIMEKAKRENISTQPMT